MVFTQFGIVISVRPPGTATSVLPSFVSSNPAADLYERFPAATLNLVRLSQPTNGFSSMLFTLLGITTLVKLMQLLKAANPILVTPLSIITLTRLSQAANAQFPTLFTLFGIVTLVRPLQPRNT
jgi:hypothetical protein